MLNSVCCAYVKISRFGDGTIMWKRTAMKVGGRDPNVTHAMIRMSVGSLLVEMATLFESSAIDHMTELSCKLSSAHCLEAPAWSIYTWLSR